MKEYVERSFLHAGSAGNYADAFICLHRIAPTCDHANFWHHGAELLGLLPTARRSPRLGNHRQPFGLGELYRRGAPLEVVDESGRRRRQPRQTGCSRERVERSAGDEQTHAARSVLRARGTQESQRRPLAEFHMIAGSSHGKMAPRAKSACRHATSFKADAWRQKQPYGLMVKRSRDKMNARAKSASSS